MLSVRLQNLQMGNEQQGEGEETNEEWQDDMKGQGANDWLGLVEIALSCYLDIIFYSPSSA